MARRRTRSQFQQESEQHICRFESCGASLRSASALKAHQAGHHADKPLQCSSSDCTVRFATSAEREEHMRVVHKRRRSKRRRSEEESAVLAPDSQPVEEEEEVSEETIGKESPDEEAENEANEITENAAYLASQMKIARSYGIAKWIKQDYHNAHLWAVWVQNAVNDFSDVPLLTNVLKQKRLNIDPLRNAERAFFDSVLGYEGLSSEILQHLISSVSPGDQEEADEEQEKESFDCLVAAIAAASERKRELVTLDELLRDIDAMIPYEIVPTDSTASAARGGERRHDVMAKADVLLKRHNRLPSSEIEQHLHEVSDKLGDEMFEILANEARLACDLARKQESDASTKETTRHLFTFIRNEFEKNKEAMLRRMDHDILVDLCEQDCQLFDSYLSFLLQKHHDLSNRPADRTMEMVKGGVVSLRQAAKERVRTGTSQDLELEEVHTRIRELTKRRGYVIHYHMRNFSRLSPRAPGLS